ncbi:hypothetical protein FHR33_005146 [Nonomuraea dietziae]|uniref:Uncharacterized protein n=1 Tax=Nonomuraea dietziae TaxID=65515 RepID=A0A7W5V2I9_9ACTN|nr:hypothetical protein [Nonomuraea dietziae]
MTNCVTTAPDTHGRRRTPTDGAHWLELHLTPWEHIFDFIGTKRPWVQNPATPTQLVQVKRGFGEIRGLFFVL